jgi:hypothetical protein
MLYYVIQAITRDNCKRVRSFSCKDTAQRYADALIREDNNQSFYIGVASYDEWYHSFA